MAFAVGDVIDAIVQQAETWWLSNGLHAGHQRKLPMQKGLLATMC